MDAFFARNRLSAYLDGELTAAEAREVEAALARDPALRNELEALRAAVDLLRNEGLVEPPPGFADRLAARLEREPMPVGWRRWVREVRPEAVMLAAAAFLVVVYVGNKDKFPELTPPEGAPVVAAKAFDKGDGTPTQDAAVEPPAPDLAAAAPAPNAPEAAAPATSAMADGVLGNEAAKPKAASKTQSLAERLPSPKSAPTPQGSVEPWRASWEQEADDVANTAAPAASNTAQFYSPPPFRYRIAVHNDMALKELGRIAKELGGELQDARGKPLAAFQLDQGTTESVRVSVPAHNQARLAERLRELGVVERLKEQELLLTDPNVDVPMAVELAY